ncbi:MAG: hypothetical protein IT377_01490 [Polyangiaceae bacterium]|nr:hypothetical protein [Polyangiaceae bacterium]
MHRALTGLALLATACTPDASPVATARAAGGPDASGADAAEAAAPSLVADAGPARSSTLIVKREGGGVPAAQALRVLHVGDSMAPLVGNYLRPIFEASGRSYFIETVVSSSTLEWAGKGLLREAMYKYDPELILISLGSNELFDPKPARRGAAVEQMVTETRGRPCMWIGPPLWKQDSGFVEVLKTHLGHCQFFDSSRLELPRMADGRHPSWTGGWRWADAVWRELGGTEPVPTGSRPKLTPD